MINRPQNHHPKYTEQLFFLISGALVSSPLPSFYNRIGLYLMGLGWSDFSITLILTSLFAPFLEEFAKAYPLFFRHNETEKSLFRLGFLVGLGFGIAEFLLYIFVHDATVLSRLPGLLFHATNTSIVAYGISKNKTIGYYLIAVFLHFINNFTASYGDFWYIFGILATLTSYFLSLYLSRQVKDKIVTYWS